MSSVHSSNKQSHNLCFQFLVVVKSAEERALIAILHSFSCTLVTLTYLNTASTAPAHNPFYFTSKD